MRMYQLDDNVWQQLYSLGTSCRYNAGDILYMQGESFTNLFCIKQGRIKNCTYFAKGVEKVLYIQEAPALSGETAVVDDGLSISSAVALTPVEAVIIPRKTAQEFLFKNPEVMMFLVRVFAEKLRSMHAQAESLVLNNSQKLAALLLNYHNYVIYHEPSLEGRLIITHDQLAGFLGSARPKVTNSLNHFADQGIIRKGRGYIEIIDEQRLREIAQADIGGK